MAVYLSPSLAPQRGAETCYTQQCGMAVQSELGSEKQDLISLKPPLDFHSKQRLLTAAHSLFPTSLGCQLLLPI